MCEDDGEEFSLEHGDLEMILDGLNPQDYENTIAIGQMKIETNQNLASALQNYASNYYSTGSKDICLDAAILNLSKKKKDVERELRSLLNEQQGKKDGIEREKSYVWREIQKLEDEIEEYDRRIERQELEQEEVEAQDEKRWRVHPAEYIGVLLIAIILYPLLDEPLNYLSSIVILLAEGLRIWHRLKDGKQKSQQEVLQEVSSELQKLIWMRERLQEEVKEKRILYGNLQEKLEELEGFGSEYQKKEQRRKSLEYASEKLLELSREVHRELAVQLNQKASEILREITNGRYDMLLIDEKLKMNLFTGERKISIDQVSRGTVEQIYFALRMAATEILYEEEYPIILDETFVFYDDFRLESTLRWLIKSKKQVIIFTCQKREKEILK